MERRTLWAILLMMAIAIAPAFFIKRNAKPAVTRVDAVLSRPTGAVARPGCEL